MKFALTLALVASIAFASESEAEAEGVRDIRAPAYGYDAGQYGVGKAGPATQPTYGWKKGLGYGVYDMPKRMHPRIANDGYRVKVRTDIGDRIYETVYAKCVMMDPDYNSDIYGVFRLIQNSGDKTTGVWGEVGGVADGEYKLTINALGDLRDGCDSTGAVFNPMLSASGYGVGKVWPDKATGDLGSFTVGKTVHYGYDGKAVYGDSQGEIDVEAGADLSGTWSIMGRSLVVSSGDEKLGCCTIGLAAGKKAPAYKEVSYGHGYEAPKLAYQPHGGYGAGYGAGYGGASYGGASYGGASYGGSYGGASYGGAAYGVDVGAPAQW